MIRYLYLKGMSPKEIYDDMLETLGEDVPSYSTVKKWAAEFKRGRQNLVEVSRSGRPVTASTLEIVGNFYLIMANRRITERYIATEVNISQERDHAIIANE